MATACRDFDDSGLKVEWDDLLAPSDEARLENVIKMADANEREWKVSGGRIFEPNEMREMAQYETLDELEELPFMEGEEGGDDVPSDEQ